MKPRRIWTILRGTLREDTSLATNAGPQATESKDKIIKRLTLRSINRIRNLSCNEMINWTNLLVTRYNNWADITIKSLWGIQISNQAKFTEIRVSLMIKLSIRPSQEKFQGSKTFSTQPICQRYPQATKAWIKLFKWGSKRALSLEKKNKNGKKTLTRALQMGLL